MREVREYIADDGAEFFSLYECREHEGRLVLESLIRKELDRMQDEGDDAEDDVGAIISVLLSHKFEQFFAIIKDINKAKLDYLDAQKAAIITEACKGK